MTPSTGTQVPRSRKLHRRLERWLVGIGMAIIAWVIERRVIGSIRAKGASPTPARAAAPRKGLSMSSDEIGQ